MGRKYYIPRTRSGSSMLASVLTQYLDNERKKRSYELSQRFNSGEISVWKYQFLLHPCFFIWIMLTPIIGPVTT